MLKFRWETELKKTEIGEIPKEWEIEKLGELCSITSSKRIYFKEYDSHGIPFYRGKEIILLSKGENITNSLFISLKKYEELKSKYGIPQAGDLLLTAIGTIGYIYRVKESDKFYFKDGNILWIRNFTKGINSLYLKYILPLLLKVQELSIGSSQEALTIEKLKELITLLPPPTEQSRIATVLSWFDDLIENKKRQNEILEKTAMAIFKSWFVDFEPFKDEEFVYNADLDREVLKGWEVDSTTRIIDFNPTLRLKRGKEYPFVEMKHVSTNSAVCNFDYKEFRGSGVKYRGGDTLMARITPSLEHGKTAYVWFISEKENGFGTTEFFVLHPREPYLKEFIYLFAKSDDLRDVAINSMTGTSGRQRADVNALKKFLIPIPPQPILEKFHSLVEPLFQKIILNQKQIMVLRKIRDALLPQLVFGKLRVVEL